MAEELKATVKDLRGELAEAQRDFDTRMQKALLVNEQRLDELAEARELRQEQVVAAYIAGAQAVHENWQEDRCPDFTEAAHDHWATLDAATSTNLTQVSSGLVVE
jgi:cell division septum initiation protein DivIVA